MATNPKTYDTLNPDNFVDFLGEYSPHHGRFGQAFCNAFNLTDSEIFFESNKDIALKKIVAKHFHGVGEANPLTTMRD